MSWLIISLVLGFLGSVLVIFIENLQGYLRVFLKEQFILVPLLAAVLIAILISLDQRVAGLGTEEYIRYTLEDNKLEKPIKLFLYKLLATIITIGMTGLNGVVGPLLLLGSSLAAGMNKIFLKFNMTQFNQSIRTLSLCGAAATLGPLLGAPLGAGVFVSEVLYKSALGYNDIFPAILSSSFGYFFYYSFTPYARLNLDLSVPQAGIKDILLMVVVSLICGVIGQSFIFSFNLIKEFFTKVKLSTISKTILVAIVIIIAIYFIGADDFLDSVEVEEFLQRSLKDSNLILIILIKIFLIMLLINSGYSIAIVDIAIITGALSGHLLFYIFPQIPLHVLVFIGLSATLASIANVPLATIIIVIEIFNVNLSLPIIIGSIIGYIVGRPRVVFKYISEK